MTTTSRKVQLAFLLLAAAAFVGGVAADGRLREAAARSHAATDPATMVAIEGSTASTDANAGLDADLSPVVLVGKVLKVVKDYYVEDINPFENSKMAHNAVRYMVSSLGDPNSRFLDEKQAETLVQSSLGKFSGIGAVLKIKESKKADWTDQDLTVVAAMPGSPAARAGILPGDVVEEVNGKWVMSHDPFSEALKVTKDRTSTANDRRKAVKDAEDLRKRAIALDEAHDMLMASQKEPLNLKVRRGTATKAVSVSTANVTAEPVESRLLEPGIGYVHITLFTPDTPARFTDALKDLKSKGAKKLVLDLRNSAGGSITAAQAVAGTLMPNKRLAVILRGNDRKDTVTAKPATTGSTLPVIALINQGTEGASEVLAGGLRDSASVRLIGANSWGNSLERTAFRLADGSGYTLTTGKYLTPAGTDYLNKGLKPDAVVPMSPASVGTASDPQLARALLVAKRPA